MRQITKEAVDAFLNGYYYKKSNMEVTCGEMYLHGHKIAWLDINGQLWVSNCGYQTNTTKERLNGLPSVNIRQINFTWYLNGKEWDGRPKCIGKIL